MHARLQGLGLPGRALEGGLDVRGIDRLAPRHAASQGDGVVAEDLLLGEFHRSDDFGKARFDKSLLEPVSEEAGEEEDEGGGRGGPDGCVGPVVVRAGVQRPARVLGETARAPAAGPVDGA